MPHDPKTRPVSARQRPQAGPNQAVYRSRQPFLSRTAVPVILVVVLYAEAWGIELRLHLGLARVEVADLQQLQV